MTQDEVKLGCAAACLAVAFYLMWYIASAGAQAPIEVQIGSALQHRLQVWERPDGGRIYVRHCREAYNGCEARIRRLSTLLAQAGARHGVDPWLLAAIAVHESGTNPNRTGRAGEFGVMQLHPLSRRGREATMRCAGRPGTCPDVDIDAAAHLVRVGIDRCGGEGEALGLYNRGQCGVTRYSRAVLRLREELRAGAS